MSDKENMMDTEMEVADQVAKEKEEIMDEVKEIKELTPHEKLVKEKQAWVNEMRLKFCIRPDFEVTKNMIKADGTLNQDYFRPTKGDIVEARKWTEVEKQLLIDGIEKHGIGHFGEISKESLPKWSTNDLRVKCIRLIGRQNLQLYRGWKGNADDIAREYEKNKQVGLKYGTWKQGVLVYDDDGKVEKELIAMHANDNDKDTEEEDDDDENEELLDEDEEDEEDEEEVEDEIDSVDEDQAQEIDEIEEEDSTDMNEDIDMD
ncbi:hypothetical protein BJ944DRAFT_237448 [Cunninghamella echinulata]|nr:hypothetical protein BJ944DRAFT_237448 [Cunninghamella echinulata]